MNESYSVLVVDDDAFIRDLVSTRLIAFGYRTLIAGDGEEAYALYVKEKPQAVICDILMPKMNGYQFCRKLRDKGDHVPFLFLSSVGNALSIGEAIEAGANLHITKPFDAMTLDLHLTILLKKGAHA